MKTNELPLNRIRAATTRIELELMGTTYPDQPDYAFIRIEKRRIKAALKQVR